MLISKIFGTVDYYMISSEEYNIKNRIISRLPSFCKLTMLNEFYLRAAIRSARQKGLSFVDYEGWRIQWFFEKSLRDFLESKNVPMCLESELFQVEVPLHNENKDANDRAWDELAQKVGV